MNDQLIQLLAEKLRRRLAEISEERATNAEARQTVTLDQASVGRVSRIDALQAQQLALAQDRNRSAEVQLIEAALQRMEDGTYGYCITCDEEIAEKRLRLNPAVATCIDCAR